MSERSRERPTKEQAEAAVRTLIEWAGDDPDREGLLDTPGRVTRAYSELFAGYEVDPHDYLKRTFEEVSGYDELVVLSGTSVASRPRPISTRPMRGMLLRASKVYQRPPR